MHLRDSGFSGVPRASEHEVPGESRYRSSSRTQIIICGTYSVLYAGMRLLYDPTRRCSHERLSATIYADAIISLPRSFHRYLPRFHANAAPIATALPSSNPSNYLPVLYLNPPEYLNPLGRVITRNPTLGVPAFPSVMLQFRAAFGSFRQFPRFAATRRDSTQR